MLKKIFKLNKKKPKPQTQQRNIRTRAPKSPTTTHSLKLNRHEIYKAWHKKQKQKINQYKQIIGTFEQKNIMQTGDEILKNHRHEDPFTKIKKILETYKKK